METVEFGSGPSAPWLRNQVRRGIVHAWGDTSDGDSTKRLSGTRTVDVVEDYFGTSVPDPYRWLEDTDDPEVAEWLAAQAAVTRAHLDGLPDPAPIRALLDLAVRRPHSGLPRHHGLYWFRTHNDGVQQQDVLLVEKQPFDGDATVLIDPNTLGDASRSIAAFQPSPDGELVAYSYSEAGSDWRTWRVRETATGADRPDEVRWSKFTWPRWLPDGSGFVYGAYDAPSGDSLVASNRDMRIMLHRLGAGGDDLVFALPDEPDVSFWPEITEDGRWLVVHGTKGTEHRARVWLADLSAGLELHPLIPVAEASWQLVGSLGEELVMLTDSGAPLGRLVAITADGAVRELVAERADQLEAARLAGGRLVVQWLHDAAARLTVHELDGTQVATPKLPGLGSVADLEASAEDAVLHLAWTTFTAPPAVLAYRVDTDELGTAFETPLDTDLVTEQTFVTSKDGTRVPLFLVHRPDVSATDGPHPTWLYGYGGFRVAITPSFDASRFAFASGGGVVAVACLRGGAEYGRDWHDAGRLANKQNVFDDAAACAEYLVGEGWTDREHLALSGRSNGGLLAGAVVTQHPDLFAAVVPRSACSICCASRSGRSARHGSPTTATRAATRSSSRPSTPIRRCTTCAPEPATRRSW